MSNLHLLDRQVAMAFYGGFAALRPAQEAAIAPLVDGQNVVLSSATGSGKTEAIIAPILSRLMDSAIESGQLLLLYIAPTKALINDLYKRLSPPCSSLGLRLGLRHGDRDDLVSGPMPHVLLTTPESLDVLMFRKDEALRSIQAAVIDEAHLLYNTQRGLQLSMLLRRLERLTGNRLQWVALSATIAHLPHIRDFFIGQSAPCVFLEFPASRPIDAHILQIQGEEEFARFIKKITAGAPTKLLAFANSRRECERLASILAADNTLCNNVYAHYSSLSTEVRLETERRFAESRTAICIATSTLELGIDIGDIDAIILWDTPGSIDSFLQRIGRGNRRTHKVNVICLVPDTSRMPLLDTLHFLTLIGAARNGEMPIKAPYELFGAIIQQCLSLIGSDSGCYTKVSELLANVGCQEYIDRTLLDRILDELTIHGYLQRHGFKNQYGAEANLFRLIDYRLIYGNFPAASHEIQVIHASKVLGQVPAINLMRLQKGMVIRFAGRRWLIDKLSPESIQVSPTEHKAGAMDFSYAGAVISCETFIANRMWHTIHCESCDPRLLSQPLWHRLSAAIEGLRNCCTQEQLPYFLHQDGLTYLTFGGQLVNTVIPLLSGQYPSATTDISFTVPRPLRKGNISLRPDDYHDVFKLIQQPQLNQTIYQSLLPVDLQSSEFIQDWLKDRSVVKVLERLAGAQIIEIPQVIANPWMV